MHAGRFGRVGALGLLGLVLSIAGCGGGDGGQTDRSASYERGMRAVVSELAKPFAMGFGFVDVENDRDAAALAKQMAGDFRRTSSRAQSIQAPTDVANEHAAFVAALDHVADNFEGFAESGGKDVTALDRSDDAFESLNRSLNAIQRKGYDLNWK
jgi:hypothetical protein